MTDYRLLTLSTLTPLESAGPLPAWLVAANPSEDQITDLGWSGRTGQGYFPIIVADAPAFDPDTHRLSDPVEGEPDPKTKTIPAVREVVTLTADEIAARNPVPEIVSARQFFQQLAKDGDCTEAEALAYVQTGALPAALSTVIDSLPEGIRFDVRMEVIGANEFYRSTPTVDLVGYLLGKDSAALDRIWRLASKL